MPTRVVVRARRMTGGLFDPLGRDRVDRAGRTGLSTPVILTATALVVVAALLLAASFRDNDRGEPHAVSTIEHVQAPPPVPKPAVVSAPQAQPAPAVPPSSNPPTSALPPVRDDQDVEIQNGVRIIRPRRSGASAQGQTLSVPGPTTPEATSATRPGTAGGLAKP